MEQTCKLAQRMVMSKAQELFTIVESLANCVHNDDVGSLNDDISDVIERLEVLRNEVAARQGAEAIVNTVE